MLDKRIYYYTLWAKNLDAASWKKKILWFLCLVYTSLITLFLGSLLCLISWSLYYFWLSFTSESISGFISGLRSRHVAVEGIWETNCSFKISTTFHFPFQWFLSPPIPEPFQDPKVKLCFFLAFSSSNNCISDFYTLTMSPLHFTFQHAADLTHILPHPFSLQVFILFNIVDRFKRKWKWTCEFNPPCLRRRLPFTFPLWSQASIPFLSLKLLSNNDIPHSKTNTLINTKPIYIKPRYLFTLTHTSVFWKLLTKWDSLFPLLSSSY